MKRKFLICCGIGVAILTILTSCEQKISVESVVSADGEIGRTITFHEADSTVVNKNLFGITAGDWKTRIEIATGDSVESEKKYTISFERKFSSAEDANQAMDRNAPAAFRIRSSFEKHFRWFYTYIRYSDTYVSLNRFHRLKASDFFTEEDYRFIRRLPAEGKAISKADSIYLDKLTEKLGEFYGRAIFEEHYYIFLDAIGSSDIDRRWIDSLHRNKEPLFKLFASEQDGEALPDAFMTTVVNKLAIGFPAGAVDNEYKQRVAALKPTTDFMSTAATEAKLTHTIRMPWTVVETTADSAAGNMLVWKPLTVKFILDDYTMAAESRQMNFWAIAISAIIVALTVYLFLRRRTSPF